LFYLVYFYSHIDCGDNFPLDVGLYKAKTIIKVGSQ